MVLAVRLVRQAKMDRLDKVDNRGYREMLVHLGLQGGLDSLALQAQLVHLEFQVRTESQGRLELQEPPERPVWQVLLDLQVPLEHREQLGRQQQPMLQDLLHLRLNLQA